MKAQPECFPSGLLWPITEGKWKSGQARQNEGCSCCNRTASRCRKQVPQAGAISTQAVEDGWQYSWLPPLLHSELWKEPCVVAACRVVFVDPKHSSATARW